MAVTAANIARVRSLADASVADFNDAAITAVIELYTRRDADGNFPDEDGYTDTYDLYRAAADVVEQRAAKVATQYNTTADGATLNRSSIQEQLFALAVRLRNRAAAKANRSIIETTEDDEDE